MIGHNVPPFVARERFPCPVPRLQHLQCGVCRAEVHGGLRLHQFDRREARHKASRDPSPSGAECCRQRVGPSCLLPVCGDRTHRTRRSCAARSGAGGSPLRQAPRARPPGAPPPPGRNDRTENGSSARECSPRSGSGAGRDRSRPAPRPRAGQNGRSHPSRDAAPAAAGRASPTAPRRAPDTQPGTPRAPARPRSDAGTSGMKTCPSGVPLRE